MTNTRSREERVAAAMQKLENDGDVWLASASAAGEPHLVPLSLSWNGREIVVATEARSITTSNVRATRRVRLALGASRDVVLIRGTAEVVPCAAASAALISGFARRTNWDPSTDGDEWVFLVITPTKIQVWRDLAEMQGRTVMNDGSWLR